MNQIQRALLLASAMIATAIFGVFDIIPETIAQGMPVALLLAFPSVLQNRSRCVRAAGQ